MAAIFAEDPRCGRSSSGDATDRPRREITDVARALSRFCDREGTATGARGDSFLFGFTQHCCAEQLVTSQPVQQQLVFSGVWFLLMPTDAEAAPCKIRTNPSRRVTMIFCSCDFIGRD